MPLWDYLLTDSIVSQLVSQLIKQDWKGSKNLPHLVKPGVIRPPPIQSLFLRTEHLRVVDNYGNLLGPGSLELGVPEPVPSQGLCPFF